MRPPHVLLLAALTAAAAAAAEDYSPVAFASRIVGLGKAAGGPAPAAGLRVIVSGLSRTGTQSIKYALRSVGHRCYHTEELVSHGHAALWYEAIPTGPAGDAALRRVAEEVVALGYDCVVDLTWPWSARLSQLFPSARVLHSERDSPEKWYASWLQIAKAFAAVNFRPFRWLIDFEFHRRSVRELGGVEDFYAPPTVHPFPWVDIMAPRTEQMEQADKAKWIEAYRRQRRTMEAVVPAGQLLVYNVKQGWPPLCSFLELGDACPTTPFPHINQGVDLSFVKSALEVVCYVYPLILFLLAAAVLVCVRLVVSLLGYCYRAVASRGMAERSKKDQ